MSNIFTFKDFLNERETNEPRGIAAGRYLTPEEEDRFLKKLRSERANLPAKEKLSPDEEDRFLKKLRSEIANLPAEENLTQEQEQRIMNKIRSEEADGAEEPAGIDQHKAAQGNDEYMRMLKQRRADGAEEPGAEATSSKWKPAPSFEQVKSGQGILKKGLMGKSVSMLQEILNTLGITSSQISTDGKFGAETETAVKEYQTNVKKDNPEVQVDGIVGKTTMTSIERDTNYAPTPDKVAPITTATTTAEPDAPELATPTVSEPLEIEDQGPLTRKETRQMNRQDRRDARQGNRAARKANRGRGRTGKKRYNLDTRESLSESIMLSFDQFMNNKK